MNSNIEVDDLKASFKSAFNKHGWKKKKRYYSFKTTENFIFHLPKIKDKSEKQLAINNLTEYLVILNNMPESEDLDATSGDELFLQYLRPLINIYEIRLGFALFISLPYLIALFILAELISFGLKASLWVHLMIDIVFVSYFVYQLYKMKQRKVYGFFV